MENIAALSASLREKDAEKSVIADAIKAFEDLKKQSIIGKLRFVITGVTDAKNADISSNCQFDVKISEGASEFSAKTVNDVMDSHITSKDSSIEVTCNYAETRYVASINMRNVPENDSLADVVDAVSESEKLLISVKTTFDTMDGLIESKTLELQQIQNDIKAIAQSLREVSQQSLKPKEKKTKKKKTVEKVAEPVQEIPEEEGSSLISTAVGYAVTGLNLLLEQRAYVVFGVAAGVIYAYGDALSV